MSTQKTSKTKKKGGEKATPSTDVFDAERIAARLTKDIQSLKIEAEDVHTKVQDEKIELEKEKAALEQKNSKESQMEAIKGKELLPLSRLKHMGFEEDIIKEHIERENRKLERETVEKRKERYALDQNIQKMKKVNEQSEKAVALAQLDVQSRVLKSKKLQAELDEVELAVYALENKVNLSRSTRDVDIFTGTSLRHGIENIINDIKKRSSDKIVVKKVLKVAATCLADTESFSYSKTGAPLTGTESDDSSDVTDASSIL